MRTIIPFRLPQATAPLDYAREPAEVISLDARRISQALARQHELLNELLDFGPKEF